MKIKRAPDYTNKYARRFQSSVMRWLMDWPMAGIAVHWFFQGMLYMDLTERSFKLALDVVLTLLGGVILIAWLPWYAAWFCALLIAHTFNFLFNAQLWVVLKHYGLVHHTYEEFEDYLDAFKRRVRTEPSIFFVAVYGSLVREEWKSTSDLDVRIVRLPGLLNGLRACLFVVRERTRALVNNFPLDAYVLDGMVALDCLRADELPLVLLDRRMSSK